MVLVSIKPFLLLLLFFFKSCSASHATWPLPFLMAKVKAKSISFPNALLSTPNVCRVKTCMPVLCGWGWYCEDQWTVTKWIMEHKSNRTLLKSFRCYLLSHRKLPSYFTVNEQKNAALHTVFVRLFVKDGVSLCALTTSITLWFSMFVVFVAVTGGEVGKLSRFCRHSHQNQ